MAIWHCSHPNIAMLDNRVCKDTISSRDVSSAVLSEMPNIYHEGCPLYRTSTEHICNLLSFPIAMRIISRLLAKPSRSKCCGYLYHLLLKSTIYCSHMWSPLPSAGEPSDQYGGFTATPRLWSWNGLYTTDFYCQKALYDVY